MAFIIGIFFNFQQRLFALNIISFYLSLRLDLRNKLICLECYSHLAIQSLLKQYKHIFNIILCITTSISVPDKQYFFRK